MRKLSANYVYSPERGFVKNGILQLSGEGEVIRFTDPGGNFREEAGLEHYNGILVPGFVNAHCHLELSYMKGMIPEHTGLDQFIYAVVTGREFDLPVIEKAIREADREMQREGIVAVGDISNTSHSFPMKAQSRIHYHTFVEIFNMQNAQAEKTFREGMALLDTARDQYHLSASLTPHASYSVSEKLFELFRKHLNNQDNRLSIHNQETTYEDEFIGERKGNFLALFEKLGFEQGDSKARHSRSLPWLSRVVPPRSPLLLVHNVHTTQEDMDAASLDLSKTSFCLCPNSNRYIADILPGTFLMKNFPENVCTGTDSLASNHRLSILSELITLDMNYPETGLHNLFRFATINGARALGLEDTLGSFSPGKKPGVNLIGQVDLQGMRLRRESFVTPRVTPLSPPYLAPL